MTHETIELGQTWFYENLGYYSIDTIQEMCQECDREIPPIISFICFPKIISKIYVYMCPNCYRFVLDIQ